MPSFLPYRKTLNQIVTGGAIRGVVLPLLLSNFLLSAQTAQAAPTRQDWCGTIWSVENQSTLAWINPTTGVTTTASGPTSQITMPGGSMGTATAAIGIHKESGTMYAFDRTGTTGTLYKYKFGVDSSWQTVSVSGLLGLSGTQSISGASNNLNKMSVDGNTLFIAESNGIAVYAIPLNSSGTVVGSPTVQTYSFVGDPFGTAPHRTQTAADPTGTEVINGGDIVTDEFGDVYNITYNIIIGYDGSGNQTLTVTKAYFYKQDPVARTWIYQGETAGNAQFAGAAFYRGDLYVKAGTQLKEVDLTRSGSGYTGWSNPLVNVGGSSSTSSADLAACGVPVINLAKSRQIYTDAALTTLATNQTQVRTGQYIKYTVTAQNVGDAWARSTQIIDNLPTGTVYQPNSATLNGTNLGLATYPSSFTINSPSISSGIVRYSPDPDLATLSFAVQVTTTSGSIANQASTTYVDNDGLTSNPPTCATTPKVNCANDNPAAVVVPAYSVSGTVWNDADGSITINGSETGTNAGSSNLTMYALDTTGKVVDKATVATNGTYSIPYLIAGNYTLRISNDASVAVGSTAPVASLPSNWVNTGENKNGVTETTTPGEIALTIISANISNQNFGIEQPPTAVGGTATSQTNPGGTSTVTVPSTLFTGSTDPDGTVASYKITAFPSNATSITINGTNYTSASFPGGGVTVTTAQLAGMVVDPVDGAVSVGISFKAIDNAGKESSNTATATLPFTPSAPALSSSSCPAGTTQTVGSLVTNGSFATLPANTSNPGNSRTNPGTFFPDANFYSQAANRGFDIYPNAGGGDNAFSIQEGLFGPTGWSGNQVPFPGDPANNIPATTRWYYSNGNAFYGGEYLLWEQDVTGANLLQAGKTYTFYAYVTNVIEPTDNAGDDPIIRLRIDGTSGLPDGTVVTGPIRLLEGAATSDASDTTNIQVPTNNALPLNGWVRVGYTFTPSVTTSSMKLKLTSAATGEWGDDFGLTAFGLSECVLSIQGTVWDDANGSANGTFTGIQNGSETGANASGLNAILVDAGGNVVATSTVAANGTYTLNGVSTNQAGLTIRLSTTAGTVGAAAPAASVPAGWIATSPLTTAAFNSGTTSLSGRDFGIERLPDTTALNPASQTNPGGTTTVQVPTLAGTDPEDGALGSGKSFKIVTLPTNGTLTYNGTAVTAGQTIANYNPALLLLDPNDGAITVSFTYAAVDAAGQVDPAPATVTMPFSSVANVLLIKRITAINGDRTQNPNDNTPLNLFVDDTTSSKAAEDNDSKWVTNYLKGAINAGKVKPGDTIEYTIYFLNAGNANANTVRICDRLQPNQIFQPNGYGVGTGVQVQMGTSSVINLTNANDGSDRTQFIAAGGAVPTNCNITAANTDGTLVVDITGAAATGNPTLVTMPGATAAGSPNDSYGFFRFITQVNP